MPDKIIRYKFFRRYKGRLISSWVRGLDYEPGEVTKSPLAKKKFGIFVMKTLQYALEGLYGNSGKLPGRKSPKQVLEVWEVECFDKIKKPRSLCAPSNAPIQELTANADAGIELNCAIHPNDYDYEVYEAIKPLKRVAVGLVDSAGHIETYIKEGV